MYSNAQMSETQTVTFASDVKPPNYGAMKLHTKPIKRKDKDKLSLINSAYNLIIEDIPGLVEKDIVLVMFQTGVTREMAIATLRKHDGDIVNALMELIETY